MKLFIGLGNPGKKYELNRHNLGFMAIDEIARKLSAPDFLEKSGGLFTKTKDVILFKPLSFMNNSGIPASQLANFYKIQLNDIYVFYDELDVPLGKVKLKNGGGANGHNGIKSLDSHLGINYWRVRLGVNHPGHRDLVHSHVLSDFTPDELKLAEKVCKTTALHSPLLLEGNRELFLTRFFETLPPPAAPAPTPENP